MWSFIQDCIYCYSAYRVPSSSLVLRYFRGRVSFFSVTYLKTRILFSIGAVVSAGSKLIISVFRFLLESERRPHRTRGRARYINISATILFSLHTATSTGLAHSRGDSKKCPKLKRREYRITTIMTRPETPSGAAVVVVLLSGRAKKCTPSPGCLPRGRTAAVRRFIIITSNRRTNSSRSSMFGR